MNKLPGVVALIAWLTCTLGRHSAAGEVSVEGDRALLDTLRAAQITNEALFVRGALSARIEKTTDTVRNGEEGHTVETGEVTLVWDGDRSYYEYTYRNERGENLSPFASGGCVIDVPDRRIWYNRDLGLAQVGFDKKRNSPWLVRLRPDETWFRTSIPDGRPWKEMLDPETPWSSPRRSVVTREDDDRVVVEHYVSYPDSDDPDRQHGMRIVASLRQGGNIVAYEDLGEPVGSSPWDRGEYQWLPDGRGHWRLSRFEHTTISASGGDSAEATTVLEVTDFDPEPAIPRNRFQQESLNLEPGTVVEESGGGQDRTYQIEGDGEERERIRESILDDLARRLREARFASPESSE